MNRHRFLVVFGMDADHWAARYGIEPFDVPCHVCGERLTTSQPFAYDSLRGLLAPRCVCGNDETPYCVVRDFRRGDLIAGPEVPSPKARAAKRTAGRARRLSLHAGRSGE